MSLPAADVLLVRLANEGIPVQVIARCTSLPSADVYQHLIEATEAGELLEVPRADWPAGVGRLDRAPAFKCLMEVDDRTLILHLIACFKVTRLQAILLLHFLRRRETTREQMHQAIEAQRPPGERRAQIKLVDVVLWQLRKRLAPILGVQCTDTIATVRERGYTMPARHRQRVTEMLSEHLGTAA